MDKLFTHPISVVDNLLNRITAYRLTLYLLMAVYGWALVLSIFKILPFNPLDLFMSGFLILTTGWAVNEFCAWWLDIPVNAESVYISGFILALILAPIKRFDDVFALFWAAVWTIASKFIFSIFRKHVFNPAALGLFIVAQTMKGPVIWWVGSPVMLPIVLIAGLLIVRKIRRGELVLIFLVMSMFSTLVMNTNLGFGVWATFQKILLYTPWIFFASVMLTDPLITPPTRLLQITYAAMLGVLFSPQFHIGKFFLTPESAILIGNIYSYLVSPKKKYLLSLKEKIRLSSDTYDFIFSGEKINFIPGQYMEWTLRHDPVDSRGNRRYFTLASAPSEDVRLGIKFYDNSSSFKKTMLAMQSGNKILAGGTAGDFILPKDRHKKLVFVAGGIGITPFRSMVQYLKDINEPRNIVLLYLCHDDRGFVYKDIFSNTPWLKTNYILGRLNPENLKSAVFDFAERLFYISGPHSMVENSKRALREIGVKTSSIKTDFFPGFV